MELTLIAPPAGVPVPTRAAHRVGRSVQPALRAEGVDAVWNGAAFQEFRDRLSSDDPPEVCRSCSVDSGTF